MTNHKRVYLLVTLPISTSKEYVNENIVCDSHLIIYRNLFTMEWKKLNSKLIPTSSLKIKAIIIRWSELGKEAFNKYCSLNTSHHLRPGKVRHLIFCGWPNNTFDPSILPTFPRLRSLLIERGALQHINVEFPHMKRLKVNITQ